MSERRARALHRDAMVLLCHDHLWQPADFAAAVAGGVTARIVHAFVDVDVWGGPAAFDYLAAYRLKGLGVSLGTKFLYFGSAGHDDVPAAPILDRVVRRWLGNNIEWWPRMDWWSQDYARFCGLVTEWAADLGVRPDTVGQLMSQND